MQIQGFVGSASSLGVIAATLPVVGAVVSIVAGLFSIFGGGSDTAKINQAIQNVATGAAQGIDAIKRFSWSIGRLALGTVLTFWKVLSDGIGNLVKAFKTLLDALGKLYEDVIKPALRALRSIRKILDDVYRKWLRPIINVLQQVRKILAVFRAFGFKWAGALDRRIAQIEGKIIGPYIWVVRQLNGYGQWINVILTAGGVFQKPIFRNSAYANAGFLTNLWWTSQSGALTGSSAVTSSSSPDLATPAQARASFQQFATTDTGPYADVAQRARVVFQTGSIGA